MLATTTNSIDPAAIPDVFRRLGLTPIRTITFGRHGDDNAICGCIVMADYLDRSGLTIEGAFEQHSRKGLVATTKPAFIAGDERYGRQFLGGLIGGWDSAGAGLSPEQLDQYPDWKRGYLVGRGAWKACVKAGLAKEES